MSLVVPLEEIFDGERGLLARHASWTRVELGEVCFVLNGYPFKSSLFNPSRGTPIVRIRDLSRNRTETRFDGDILPEWIIRNGDILVGMDGNFRCIEWAGGEAGLNQRVCKLVVNEAYLEKRFLLYALSGYLAAIQKATSSVTVGHLSSRDIVRIPVPLPPRSEQHRIAVTLDYLLTRLRASQSRLENAPRILARFRQAILAAACSGKLTADWRSQNSNMGSAKGSITPRFEMTAPVGGLPDLPSTWCWTALGNVAQCSRGRFSVRPRNDPSCFGGKYPFIQIGDLPPEGGRINSHSQTLNDLGLAVSKMFPKGTAVIAIVGATIGNTGLLTYETCFTDSLVGIETGTEIGNRYVELFMRHQKQEIRQISYSSGGQPNLKLEILNPYPVAVPPLSEQVEIVRRVDDLFSLAERLESRLQRTTAQVNGLTQSVLAKAFRGELVPTEAELAKAEGRAFESAEQLLIRINVSRSAKISSLKPRLWKASARH
jgi:type I restriction enzyme S subunit